MLPSVRSDFKCLERETERAKASGLLDFLLLLMVIFLYISAIPVFWGGFGQETGPVFLQDVTCNGTESFLLSCSHREIGSTTFCLQFMDVGVVCQGKVMYWVGWGGSFPLSFK